MKASLYLALVITFLSCNTQKEKSHAAPVEDPKLGQINLKVTGSEDAIEAFNTGLLLLHSFEYEDARAHFLSAQELDSTMAMAYWGEAMSYNHSLWQRQERDKAISALNKLNIDPEIRLSLAHTELEKDFLKSIDILFGEGTKYERDLAYNKFLGELAIKYPDNNEVEAFYAISLLASSRNGRDQELYDKCAKIAQGIIEENKQHPGALHYLIHSYDDPDHAHLAKYAADNYSIVAPDAAHALHMPSHIYVALGDWDKVVHSNIASWNASYKRKESKQLEVKDLSFHALHWLQYGLLQKGEITKANEILDLMIQYHSEAKEKVARSYLIAMQGCQLIEDENYEDVKYNYALATNDLNLISKGQKLYAKAMYHFNKNELDSVNNILNIFKEEKREAKNILGNSEFAMCSASGYASKPPNQLDIDMFSIMASDIEARVAIHNGDIKTASNLFENACKLDESLKYSFGPPKILKPIHEAYAEWLLETGEYEKAKEYFSIALKRQPLRLRSLKGQAEALKKLGLDSELAAIEEKISHSVAIQNWQNIMS